MDDLRTLFLFDGLADEQLTQLCTSARIEGPSASSSLTALSRI